MDGCYLSPKWVLLLYGSPAGSPIMKNVSVAILQLSEAGELDFLRNKWWSSSCMQEGSAASSGQPHRLKGAFVVLGLGLGLGVMLALLELVSSSRKSAKEQKVRAVAGTCIRVSKSPSLQPKLSRNKTFPVVPKAG